MLFFDNCINILKYDTNRCVKVIKGKLIKKIKILHQTQRIINNMCFIKIKFINICVRINKYTHNSWEWFVYLNCNKLPEQFNKHFAPLKYTEPPKPLQLIYTGARDYYLTGSVDAKRKTKLEKMKHMMKQKIEEKNKLKKPNYWGELDNLKI